MKGLTEIERLGIQARLPGLKHMAEMAQAEYEKHLSLLNGDGDEAVPAKKRGRPSKAIIEAMALEAAADEGEQQTVVPVPVNRRDTRKADSASERNKSGWAKFNTPAKRRAEMLRRQRVARGEEGSGATTVWGKKRAAKREAVKPKKQYQKSRERKHGATLPRMIGKDHVVAQVAKELGYGTTQGLVTMMATNGMQHRHVPVRPGAKQRISVMSEAQYVRVKRIKGALDKITVGMTDGEKADVQRLEAMTA